MRTSLPALALAVAASLLASCVKAPAPPPAASPASPVRVPEPVRPSLGGVWLGVLHAGGHELRVQLHLDLSARPPVASLDSLDQQAFGLACANVTLVAGALSVDVPAVAGHLKATSSADGNTLEGTWSQPGADLALVLHRQAKALVLAKPTLDPALPPVGIAGLKEVLDRDLESTLATGDLAPATGAGVTVGVLLHGQTLVLGYGAARADSIYEIGSVTKTFTGLLLAQMVTQKQVSLEEPVRALLPPGTVAAPSAGAEISLLDLSTQRSGLPRMPDNFAPADPTNPYVDYDAAALYAYLAKRGVGRPDHPPPLYSNLGVGLLGQALANRAHGTYEALLHREITGPLGMRDTAITLSPAMLARFLPGHDSHHQPAHAWDLAALAGAGGIRSTAADMLVYLGAQLHPDHLPASARGSAAGRSLPAALALSHELRGDFSGGMRIALNWLYSEKAKTFWHNGATGGYSSYVSFTPDEDCAVVVLHNTTEGAGTLADDLGQHIEDRLHGRPARSLGPVSLVPAPE